MALVKVGDGAKAVLTVIITLVALVLPEIAPILGWDIGVVERIVFLVITLGATLFGITQVHPEK